MRYRDIYRTTFGIMLAIRTLDFTFFRMKNLGLWFIYWSRGGNQDEPMPNIRLPAVHYSNFGMMGKKQTMRVGELWKRFAVLTFCLSWGKESEGVWFMRHKFITNCSKGIEIVSFNTAGQGGFGNLDMMEWSLYARLARPRSPTRIHPLASLLTPSQPTTSYSHVESNE